MPQLKRLSRSEAYYLLKKAGKSESEIARLFDTQPHTVSGMITRYRQRLSRDIVIPETMWQDYERIAKKRNTHAEGLILALLSTILLDNMVGSVLDTD